MGKTNPSCRGARLSAAVTFAGFSTHSRGRTMNVMLDADSRARWLDPEAAVELQHGHHDRAEMLALRAAEMRGQA